MVPPVWTYDPTGTPAREPPDEAGGGRSNGDFLPKAIIKLRNGYGNSIAPRLIRCRRWCGMW